MKRTGLLAACLLPAIAGWGCSKNGDLSAAHPGEAPVVLEDDTSWGLAWDRLMEGDENMVQAGDIALEETEEGAIRAWRVKEEVAGESGEEATDAALLSAVRTRLAADGDTDALEIDVQVEEGVVTLRGEVGSPYEAREAMRIALDTAGVEEVVGHLQWPGPLPAM